MPRRNLPFFGRIPERFMAEVRWPLRFPFRVDNDDFANWKFPLDHSRVARCSVQYPPPTGEVSRCLARIPGESGCSGLGLGLDGTAKLGVSSSCQERFLGQSRKELPE